MKSLFTKIVAVFSLGAVLATGANAIPVTINMTADNLVANGGLCDSALCQDGSGWLDPAFTGDTSNFGDWTQSSSLSIDLGTGTHHFAWRVDNYGTGGGGNPAALLAEILWNGNKNASSSAWEIYNVGTGALIEQATEYGQNGGANIWTNVNGGAVSGISTDANWIYASENFTRNTPSPVWIRTSISIAEVAEPQSIALLGLGLVGLAFARRKKAA